MAERIVEEFQSPLEAEEALQVLLQGGVSGRVQARAGDGVDQYLNPAGRWYELWVRESDLDKAKPIIDGFRADLESDAPELEHAATEEAAPTSLKEPERPTELGPAARVAGTLIQAYAVVVVLLNVATVSRDEAYKLLWPTLAAVFDFIVGYSIRAGGRNAARVATLRFVLASVVLGAGAVWSLPDLGPLFAVLPVLLITASVLVLLKSTRSEAGIALFILSLVLMGGNALGLAYRSAPPRVECPHGASTWVTPGLYTEIGGDREITFCGDGRVAFRVGPGPEQSWCWSVEGRSVSVFPPGQASASKLLDLQSGQDARCDKPDCALVLAGVPYRYQSARRCE